MIGSGADPRPPARARAPAEKSEPSPADELDLLDSAFESSAAALAVVVGPELRFAKVNHAYRALTPRVELDPVGCRFDDVWPAQEGTALPALRRALETGEPFHAEDWEQPVAGAPRRFSLHVKAVLLRAGKALLVTLWETTPLWEARRHAEEVAERALHRASELGAVIDALPDGFVLYGPRGEILRMNGVAARAIEPTAEERELPFAARWSKYRAFTAEGWPVRSEEAPVARALAGETVRGEHLRMEGERVSVWVLASAAPIRAPGGSVRGAVLTFSDETPLHALEEARDDLVRMISHDLRTPLNTVLAQAHMLRGDSADPAKVEERAHAISRSCHRMTGMIQDLLDATLLEAGQLRMNRRAIDLAAAIPEIVERHRGALAVERVRVAVSTPQPAPVRADPERLERILVNLLSNALKYSPDGSEVAVEIGPAPGGALLAVVDRGVGITPEDLPHVFERFFRARGARRPEGLGLGLYITRLLVFAHGGRIEAESRLGRGTTLRVFLPSEVTSPTPPPGS